MSISALRLSLAQWVVHVVAVRLGGAISLHPSTRPALSTLSHREAATEAAEGLSRLPLVDACIPTAHVEHSPVSSRNQIFATESPLVSMQATVQHSDSRPGPST